MAQAWIFLLDTSLSMNEPYSLLSTDTDTHTHTHTPTPSKLDVAKEITTLLLASLSVDEAGKSARKCEGSVICYGSDGRYIHTRTHTHRRPIFYIHKEHSLVNLGDDYAHMKEVFPLEGLHLANMRETMCVKGSKDGVCV
jgi:hypothetical protein